MMILLATFLLGLFMLYIGGELLVKGSVALALKMKISTLVVGMTVVSLATSAPELFVSLQAVISGSNDIAFGNIIGSNIANIAFVLGFTAAIFKVSISPQTINLNFPFLFLITLLFGLILYYFDGVPSIVGIFFLLFLFLFIYFLIKKSRKDNSEKSISEGLPENEKQSNLIFDLVLLIFGIGLLKFGADFLVDSSITIAKKFDISERIIAITIVSIGTSIPELATSIIAATKKEDNLAVGNLIGSNIFNILAVLGMVSIFKEINISDYAILTFDYLWMLIITALLGLFIYINSKKNISRKEGLFFLLIYFTYIFLSI